MKKIFKLLLITLVLGQFSNSQTITKDASNNNPYIGEEFYYTIKISGVNDLSDLDKIEDSFGPELDYLGVDYNPSMLAMLNSSFGIGCASYTDANSTLHSFKLEFFNCNGITIGGFDTFSFKVKVKLNQEACLLENYTNKAELFLKSQPQKSITSNVESVVVNKNNPFQLQKTFRSAVAGELIYDIRLSSKSGNFYPMDFNPGQTRTFRDTFIIPNCLSIGLNDIDVVLITDDSTTPMQTASTSFFSYNKSINGNVVNIDWDLQGATEETSSILYQVKFKLSNCSACGTNLFQLQNTAEFNAKDKCGNPLDFKETFDIDNAACSGGGGVGVPGEAKICIDKRLELDGNNLNLSMKGCKGNYVITVNNCTDTIIYKNFTLTDVIPRELLIDGLTTIVGNATYTDVNNTITVNSSAYLNPGESVEITIPFEVATAQENFLIENCTDISLYGYDSLYTSVSHNVTETACATPIVTVPNKIAIVAKKSLCSEAGSECGPFENPYNLPGDTVEYALNFYNYGTVEATDIRLRDKLPDYFEIQNINTDVQIYRIERTNISNACDVTANMKNVTSKVSVNYSNSTNLLDIKMNKFDLDEFTCKGVVQYVVKIKAKIDENAPNGIYENAYTLEYKHPSDNTSHIEVSEKVTNVVNVDNLVIGYKGFNGNSTSDYIIQDCDAKTTTVKYKIVVANMGTFDVAVEIDDVVNVPNGINLVSIGNFKESLNGAPPTAINVNTTTNGFNGLSYLLEPCEYVVVTYEMVYNTTQLSSSDTVQACNKAKVKVYPKIKKQVNAIFTAQPALVENYMKAKTDAEKLNAIALIKNSRVNNKKQPASKGDFNTGLNTLCVSLSDCLKGASSGCFTDTNTQPFSFEINSMSRNRVVSATLTNNDPTNKITKIEYLLTDIRQLDTCEDEVITINRPRPRRFINSCFSCSDNVIMPFTTRNTSQIGQLNHIFPSNVSGNYSAWNKVEFEGAPTIITQDTREFNFPINLNCNGNFEFTITAIVHYEDCSVCYVTDSFEYNARFRFKIPRRKF